MSQFSYATARVRSLEPMLLDMTDVERMLGAKEAKEAYKILNLDMSKKITKDNVNKAYIKIQKKIHPDISPETSRLSSIVNEAKDIVLNDIS